MLSVNIDKPRPTWDAEDLAFNTRVYHQVRCLMMEAADLKKTGRAEDAHEMLTNYLRPEVLIYLGARNNDFTVVEDFDFTLPARGNLIVEKDTMPNNTGLCKKWTIPGNQNCFGPTLSCTGVAFTLAMILVDQINISRMEKGGEKWQFSMCAGLNFYYSLCHRLGHPPTKLLAIDELTNFINTVDDNSAFSKMRECVKIVGDTSYSGPFIHARDIDFLTAEQRPSLLSMLRRMVSMSRETTTTAALTVGAYTIALFCHKHDFVIINTHDIQGNPKGHTEVIQMLSEDAPFQVMDYVLKGGLVNRWYQMCLIKQRNAGGK